MQVVLLCIAHERGRDNAGTVHVLWENADIREHRYRCVMPSLRQRNRLMQTLRGRHGVAEAQKDMAYPVQSYGRCIMKISKDRQALWVAMPVSILMTIVLSLLLNTRSFWVGIPCGMFSYTGVFWFLMTPDERSTWKARIGTAFDSHGRLFFMGFMYVGMGLFFLYELHTPTVTAVKSVFDSVSTFGLLVVVLYIVYVVLTTHRMFFRLSTLLLRSFFMYELVLWSISNFGDEIYHQIVSAPKQTAISGISLLLIATIVWLSAVKHKAPDLQDTFNLDRSTARLAPSFQKNAALTPEARLHIATHEIGHVLTCAALPETLDELEVVMNIGGAPDTSERFQYENRGPLGFVKGTPERRAMENETLTLWRMHLLLAGNQAERFIHGQDVLGGSSDYDKWLTLADTYLANLKQGIYYPSPKNALEKERNDAQMMQLKGQQEQTLDALFSMNKTRMEEMVALLLEKRHLNYADLQPFLSRVVLPTGFPTPDFLKVEATNER